jgi:5-methylcytosine-specific restriction endonuclease McrA
MTRKRFSKRDLTNLLDHFGCKCRMCQGEINGHSGLEWDHAIPLALGGADALDNLEPLCIRCHRLKTKGDVTRIAKSVRSRQGNLGIKSPRHPMPHGRNSPTRQKMDRNRTVVDRRTGEPWKSR